MAAKVAALRDEKAKVLVDGASLVYNVAMVNSLMNIQKEYISVCSQLSKWYVIEGIAHRKNAIALWNANVRLKCAKES